MSGPITRKRARLESSNDNSHDIPEGTGQSSNEQQDDRNATRTRDKDFWYDDGTIILVAGSVEFRVYKGILSENSSVFRDMFSLPQPPIPSTALPTADGCPVVHLSDSPKDWRHVLRVYTHKNHPSPFFVTAPSYSYAMISAAVRLGHKYQMSKLLDHAMEYLKNHYVCDFDTWGSYPDYFPAGFEDHGQAIGVVNLARLTEETTVLPTALLACCALNEKIVEGFIREDGTREQLALEDIKLCLAARDRLVKKSIGIAFRVFHPIVAEGCMSFESCVEIFKRMPTSLNYHIDEIAKPDLWSVPPFDDKFGAGMLCQQCRVMVKARIASERSVGWNELPEVFDIELPVRASDAAWWCR
ncbi:uncharacterized protein TRAVEDRAFT_128344 [Trametes versicolor FP-101664 SS1]|uniref:uncharacterized protein n=1 Tax=Trametes versicolor (strain FP-101664) TaxID=717944 RepID=UPI0004622736|nr:uncharacterized protein TRAVEDRAFT_128344 [Trametes versicolor FP-101664 SS1]EIW56926.1 hypothetical protein TRAVEDRAFT_128344 [Trametes versicolor FP-101664 SS1]